MRISFFLASESGPMENLPGGVQRKCKVILGYLGLGFRS